MDYSTTYRLAQEIRDSEEYKTYHDLKESVMAEETTAALIREYRKLQLTIQMSAMSGNTANEEDMQRFSGISSLLFPNRKSAGSCSPRCGCSRRWRISSGS